ncbi:MAG: 50S ribosomal protein L24 [Simkania sp.]|nr:50S ribosomal protein L24 [Simkania sp.]
MSKWIQKGDQVLVIAGNEKGKIGAVLSRREDRVVVKGVNIRKKHVKSKDRAASSRILELEMSVHISNVVLCDAEGKKIRAKVRATSKGGKELFYANGGKEVVYRQVKKESTH